MRRLNDRLGSFLAEQVEGDARPLSWWACAASLIVASFLLLLVVELADYLDVI